MAIEQQPRTDLVDAPTQKPFSQDQDVPFSASPGSMAAITEPLRLAGAATYAIGQHAAETAEVSTAYEDSRTGRHGYSIEPRHITEEVVPLEAELIATRLSGVVAIGIAHIAEAANVSHDASVSEACSETPPQRVRRDFPQRLQTYGHQITGGAFELADQATEDDNEREMARKFFEYAAITEPERMAWGQRTKRKKENQKIAMEVFRLAKLYPDVYEEVWEWRIDAEVKSRKAQGIGREGDYAHLQDLYLGNWHRLQDFLKRRSG